MSLWNYYIFDLIVSSGNLNKAAEAMNLTPSAVSHSLMKLEKELGVPLLVRERKGVELTTYGRELLPHIRMILAMNTKLCEEVDRMKGVVKGTVRIGTFSSVCCCWLPSIIKLIQEKYPEVNVRIVQGGYEDQEVGLTEGSLDIAFVSIPMKRNLPVVRLMRDRLLCITPLEFQTKNPDYITLDEIRQQSVILPRDGYDFDAIAFMKANNLKLETPHDIIDDTSIVALVASGMGISIIPELVLKSVSGRVKIIPIESAPFRSIGVATQKVEFVTPIAGAVLKLIIQYVQEEYARELPYFRIERNNG